MTIDATKLDTVFRDCLYRDEELPADGKAPEGTVVVQGVMYTFGFHPGRLEGHREEVKAWLMALPHTFRTSEGGGWSFLNACNDEDGVQWGQHMNMEQLFCLGVGLGLAKCQMPREMWRLLPGGMPYYSVEDGEKCTAKGGCIDCNTPENAAVKRREK